MSKAMAAHDLKALAERAAAAGKSGEPSFLQAEVQAACLLGRAPDASCVVAASGIEARRDGGQWRLSGFAPAALVYAPNALVAEGGRDCLVMAESPDGALACRVLGNAAGVRVTAVQSLDGLAASDVRLDNAAAEAWPVPRDAMTPSLIALSAEIAGAAEAALDIACNRAREHKVFGRTIGSYQALAHRLADAKIDLEAMQLALQEAVNVNDDFLALRATALKALCSAAGPRIVATAQQVHGGEGYHADLPLHRFTRRAFGLSQRLGNPAALHRRLLEGYLRPANSAA
ncbi:MAG TPA: acyl-CoA dehydrogenase family protein [Burkholderiales bacterium]|nr:acyl-CoA dehydrogenase family protein [Burkholderiales bacterium]